MKIVSILVVVLMIFLLSFVPLWPEPVRNRGNIKINTWTKIQVVAGIMVID